jgi:hypothetical protein
VKLQRVLRKVQAQERQNHRSKLARGRWISHEVAYRDFVSRRVEHLVSKFTKSRSREGSIGLCGTIGVSKVDRWHAVDVEVNRVEVSKR